MQHDYDDLEYDAHLDDPQCGPIECDICVELFEPDATCMCPMCEKTVCMYCWDEHVVEHEKSSEEE